jgi:hypothetical protein
MHPWLAYNTLRGSTLYILVGSSSLLLNMSGVSSEDVVLTGGQFGSVAD